MRYLIDGYNLMYARGLLGKPLGPERFRRVRQRFLDDLAAALDPVDASQTTVVFDAASPPDGFPHQATHKGITVVFAVDDENADARIEALIARHATPKALTVVSSDHRVRQAAARRKAKAVPAEDFLAGLDARRRRRPPASSPSAPELGDRERPPDLSPEEAAYWADAFRDLEDDPETKEALRGTPAFLTDEEIAEIEREVAREPESPARWSRPIKPPRDGRRVPR